MFGYRAVSLNKLFLFAIASLFLLSQPVVASNLPESDKSSEVLSSKLPQLSNSFNEHGLALGSPIFLRIFKEESELELWVKTGKVFKLYKVYDICKWSGELGPKLAQGDKQAPEGFYSVNAELLNPWSSFHLSMNIGYPNIYDQAHRRTGSTIMIHGGCTSVGCFAMSDSSIEEIYSIAHLALEGGQPFFRVDIFPFKMTNKRMGIEENRRSKWLGFWHNLKIGYDWFEDHKVPPNVELKELQYAFEERTI